MKPMGPIARASLVAALAGLAGGCGGSQTPIPEPPVEQTALREVGEMYRVYSEGNKKPPRGGNDLAPLAPAFSHGSMALVNKDLTVFWGAPVAPGSDAVLAHEKGVPKDGGMVLLQDGQTLRKMSADEFKAAPKAGP